MTNLDSIFKSRDITLPTNVHLVKAMVFPVVMYGCESWPIKKAECHRIDAFELWCWRRLLRVPWTARRSNQSILKEINPGITQGSTVLTKRKLVNRSQSKDSSAGTLFERWFQETQLGRKEEKEASQRYHQPPSTMATEAPPPLEDSGRQSRRQIRTSTWGAMEQECLVINYPTIQNHCRWWLQPWS